MNASKSDAAPAPARKDVSTTRFAFLSESRIVELGTPEMAYEQTSAMVSYYENFGQRKNVTTDASQGFRFTNLRPINKHV